MTRLPTLHQRKVVQALKRAGFEFFKHTRSHYVMRNPTTRKTTCVPMHAKDIKRSLMKEILQQAGLSEEDFRKLL